MPKGLAKIRIKGSKLKCHHLPAIDDVRPDDQMTLDLYKIRYSKKLFWTYRSKSVLESLWISTVCTKIPCINFENSAVVLKQWSSSPSTIIRVES